MMRVITCVIVLYGAVLIGAQSPDSDATLTRIRSEGLDHSQVA
jgi:hypothetical protein